MVKKKNKINLQKIFQELDDILNKLESSELDIDKMVDLYEKGMNLTRECKIKIKEAEQKIEIINKEDDACNKDSEL